MSKDYDAEDKAKAFEVADKLGRFINTLCDEGRISALVEAMANDHRTIQQSYTRFALAWLKHLASLNDGQYDGRNVASVAVAKKLVGALDKYDLHLPTV